MISVRTIRYMINGIATFAQISAKPLSQLCIVLNDKNSHLKFPLIDLNDQHKSIERNRLQSINIQIYNSIGNLYACKVVLSRECGLTNLLMLLDTAETT